MLQMRGTYLSRRQVTGVERVRLQQFAGLFYSEQLG